MRNNIPTSHFIPVLGAGGRCGHVISRGPMGFQSYDKDDRSVGVYKSQEDAVNALLGAVQVGGCCGMDAT